MKNGWNNSPRIASMIGMGSVLIGMMALLLLWPVFSHDVAEAAGGEVIYVKADAAGSKDGTSWVDAFTDLQAALAAADDGDQIWIAAGTYYPTDNSLDREASFVMKVGVAIYGGFAGNEDPEDFNLDDRDFAQNETILSGDIDGDGELSGNSYHVIYNRENELHASAVLDGVTIQGGNADGEQFTDQSRGGGIFNVVSHPMFRNLIVRDNYAYDGGGIYNGEGFAVFFHVIIHDNQAVNGGGLYNAPGDSGFMDVIIKDNQAIEGAGVYDTGSNTVMVNMKIQGNEAEDDGGGLYVMNSDPQLTNVLISGNRARAGGGIYVREEGDLVLTNVTISGNQAYSDEDEDDRNGGGVALRGGSLKLRNSIVLGNSSNYINLYPEIDNSLVEGYEDWMYGNPEEDWNYGNPEIDSVFVDPVEAANAPTTAGDYRLKARSVVVDAGDNSYYEFGSEPDLSELTIDLDGNPRIFSDHIDLGAYELEWYTISASTDPAAGGIVEGDGPYGYLEEATVKAIANDGYTFVNWTDSDETIVSTATKYSFEVTEDTALVAHFVDQTGPGIELDYWPETWTKGEVTVYVNATDVSGIDVVKWAEGVVDEGYFVNYGTEVSTGSFNVDSNGTYTVYAQDTVGNKSVKTIKISNINTVAPLLALTSAPVELTNGEVEISVTAAVYGSDSGNELVKLNWLAGSRGTAEFAEGANGNDILSTQKFAVPVNGTYTVYALDSSGKEAVETISVANIYTTLPLLTLAAPAEPTGGKVTISVTAAVYGLDIGNELVKLNWLAGSHNAADFANGANGADILSTQQFTVTKNGTYTAYALDAAGNEAVAEIVISTIKTSSSSGGGSSPGSPVVDDSPVAEPSEAGVSLQVNASMTTIETQEDGTVMEVVKLDSTTLGKAVEELIHSGKSTLTVQVDDQEDGVKLTLPASMIQDLKQSVDQAVIDLRLNGSSYQFPLQVLEDIAEQTGVSMEDLEISLVITKASDEVMRDIEQLTLAQGATIISEVIDFKIIAEADGQPMEISEFGGTYMPRSIVVELTSNNQTVVMYDPVKKTLSFIPSLINTRPDGTKEATLFSPHNSLYLVIETDGRTFADIQGHWAQADIETLASKFIIYGVSDTAFAPGDDITRAEFTALLARSLGLAAMQKQADSRFADVDGNAWYAQVVEVAAKVGLVQGVDADHFAPNEKITREQLAVMVSGAMKLAGAPANAVDEDDVLGKFTDHDQIAGWAKQAVAQVSAAKIIQGYPDGTFAPQQIVTRAEAAAILKRFLQFASFIDG